MLRIMHWKTSQSKCTKAQNRVCSACVQWIVNASNGRIVACDQLPAVTSAAAFVAAAAFEQTGCAQKDNQSSPRLCDEEHGGQKGNVLKVN